MCIDIFHVFFSEPGPSEGGGSNAVTANSPGNKRRGFSG